VPNGHLRRGFHLEGRVKKALAGAPVDVQEQFYVLLERLSLNPTDRKLGVLQTEDAPATYTAPFDAALLTYQVLADHPVIWVAQITWL